MLSQIGIKMFEQAAESSLAANPFEEGGFRLRRFHISHWRTEVGGLIGALYKTAHSISAVSAQGDCGDLLMDLATASARSREEGLGGVADLVLETGALVNNLAGLVEK